MPRPPYKPPRLPRRPPWVTTGEMNGSLIRVGGELVVACAAHDQRNHAKQVVWWQGYDPAARITHYEQVGRVSDIKLAHLDREENLPEPATLAKTLPRKGETIYVVDDLGVVRTATFGGAIGATFTFKPSFKPTTGDSGGAILNAAGELLGHFRYGSLSPWYWGWLKV